MYAFTDFVGGQWKTHSSMSPCYLWVTVKGCRNAGFKSMGDRMKEANGVLGMVKFAANRLGSTFVIGREVWKGLVVNKLMYGCGTLVIIIIIIYFKSNIQCI